MNVTRNDDYQQCIATTPLTEAADAPSCGFVSTRSGLSHAFKISLVIPQETLAEHVIEGGLGEDFDSRALEGQFFGLLLFVALAVFDARAVVVVAEDQIASRLGDAVLVDTAQVGDDLHGFGAR